MAYSRDSFSVDAYSADAYDGLEVQSAQTWNAWGKAWGAAFGLAWGPLSEIVNPPETWRPKYRTGAGFTVPRAPIIKPIEDEEALLLFLL